MLKYAEENINLGCWSSPPQFKIPCQYKHIWLSWRGRGGKSMAWANVSGDKVGCVTLSLLEALQPWKNVCSIPRSYLGRTLCFFSVAQPVDGADGVMKHYLAASLLWPHLCEGIGSCLKNVFSSGLICGHSTGLACVVIAKAAAVTRWRNLN